MSHRISFELPEEVYASLLAAAQRAGRPPEELARELVTRASQSSLNDPLENLFGSLDTNVSDWADRHDDYIGAAVQRKIADSETENNNGR